MPGNMPRKKRPDGTRARTTGRTDKWPNGQFTIRMVSRRTDNLLTERITDRTHNWFSGEFLEWLAEQTISRIDNSPE